MLDKNKAGYPKDPAFPLFILKDKLGGKDRVLDYVKTGIALTKQKPENLSLLSNSFFLFLFRNLSFSFWLVVLALL